MSTGITGEDWYVGNVTRIKGNASGPSYKACWCSFQGRKASKQKKGRGLGKTTSNSGRGKCERRSRNFSGEEKSFQKTLEAGKRKRDVGRSKVVKEWLSGKKGMVESLSGWNRCNWMKKRRKGRPLRRGSAGQLQEGRRARTAKKIGEKVRTVTKIRNFAKEN